MTNYSANIQIRRDTAVAFTSANPTLLLGEIAFETDTGKFKVGTGTLPWTQLPYAAGGAGTGKLTSAGTNENTSVGSGALGVTGDANRNTAVGYQAGYSIGGGCDNTMVGRNAGRLITGGAGNASGFDNTCIGSSAGSSITTGNTNTFIGSLAGRDSTASGNTAVGYLASVQNTTGSGNVSIGSNAGRYNTTGNNNTAVGNDALKGASGTVVGASTAVGASALLNVKPASSSHSNTAVGYQAGLAITTGKFNVALGNQALVQNQIGDNNTALGEYSGDGCKASDNTVVGTNAAYRNWWGSGNVMVGRGAGWGNASIDSQTDEFFPTNAPYSASQNTVVGFEAFRYPKDTSGTSSTTVTIAAGTPIVVTWATSTPANGTRVAFRSTGTLPGALVSGKAYYVVGLSGTTFNLADTPGGAAINNSTAGSGTISGYLSGISISDGNTIVGYQAGSNNPMSGDYNCLFGWRAGDALTSGNNNIVIGKDQDVDSPTSDNQINIGGIYFHDRLLYTERADPAAPAANQAVVYARDNGSGKTQLCVRFNTGAVQVLATEP
jgi:hypothetical protein